MNLTLCFPSSGWLIEPFPGQLFEPFVSPPQDATGYRAAIPVFTISQTCSMRAEAAAAARAVNVGTSLRLVPESLASRGVS